MSLRNVFVRNIYCTWGNTSKSTYLMLIIFVGPMINIHSDVLRDDDLCLVKKLRLSVFTVNGKHSLYLHQTVSFWSCVHELIELLRYIE